ncbi:keratin-associated protein 19-9b-like [Cherax quadricarinatus]|uniref:keratin-associated protein 19-9b-like n=1 Tax=Cherax quadricarinatus TaxID=27406 RepID=UPI00387ED8ED
MRFLSVMVVLAVTAGVYSGPVVLGLGHPLGGGGGIGGLGGYGGYGGVLNGFGGQGGYGGGFNGGFGSQGGHTFVLSKSYGKTETLSNVLRTADVTISFLNIYK